MRSYLFDVDGTIWDSTDAVAVSWQEATKKYGVPYEHITGERLRNEFGKLLAEIGRSLFPELPESLVDQITHDCCVEENEYLRTHGPKPYDGIRELFETLSASHELFIVSNCQAGYIEVMLERTGLSPFVRDHLCPGDTGKAKCDNIKEIIRRYQLEDPVYVGDTMGDYQAAKDAGIPFIFADYGFGNVPNPDAVIHQPLDLLTL